MSVTLSVKAYSDNTNPLFVRHYNVVKACIENNIDFPEQTKEFFRGKIELCADLEDYKQAAILGVLHNGIQIPLAMTTDTYNSSITIDVASIPKEVTKIVVTAS